MPAEIAGLSAEQRDRLGRVAGGFMLKLDELPETEDWGQAVAYIAAQLFVHAVRTPPSHPARAIAVFNHALSAWDVSARLVELGLVFTAPDRPSVQ